MNKTFNRQFGALLAFLAFGACVFIGMYYLVRNTENGGGQVVSASTDLIRADSLDIAALSEGRIRITRDRPVRLEGAIVTFRGLFNDDTLLLDIVIPELDPEVTYHRKMTVRSGKKGFQLANRQFRLVSAWKNSIKLERLPREG